MTTERDQGEAGVVLDLQGNPIYWHVPANRSLGGIPDSRDLWDVLWENRKSLSGFAHSHPGGGVPGPSSIDHTSIVALERGLGMRLDWYIASRDHLVVGRWIGPDSERYLWPPASERPWLARLREVSYGDEFAHASQVSLGENSADVVLATLAPESEGDFSYRLIKGRDQMKGE
jgi:hypothetical protein